MRFTLIVMFLVGCARDVEARFPAPADAPTGRLVLLLSTAASGVSVAVNGVLVVEDAHTQKITIDNVPTGSNEIAIAANGGDKQMRTWITSDHPTTIPLGVPEASAGFVKSLVGTLVTVAAYALLR
jgi:hypothetical protein